MYENEFELCLIKRELGEIPRQSRHCDSWFFVVATEIIFGKEQRMFMLKSGDLLVFFMGSCGRRERPVRKLLRSFLLFFKSDVRSDFFCT